MNLHRVPLYEDQRVAWESVAATQPEGQPSRYGFSGPYFHHGRSVVVVSPIWLHRHLKVNVSVGPVKGDPNGRWKHISVSRVDRKMPTWEQMGLVRRAFFDEEWCVVQVHPPKSEYVNLHPTTLHLWSKVGERTLPDLRISDPFLGKDLV